MDTDFCVAALEESINCYGAPEIQSSQFTSHEFSKTLRDASVRISMDGCGRWITSWSNGYGVKYECVYLRQLSRGSELCEALAWWFDFYNNRLPYFTFDGMKPMYVYQSSKLEGIPPLAWNQKAA